MMHMHIATLYNPLFLIDYIMQKMMVSPRGFEPLTPRFNGTTIFIVARACPVGLSLHLSLHKPQMLPVQSLHLPHIGSWLGIAMPQVSPNLSSSTRIVSYTAPNRFRNLVLYPAELRGRNLFVPVRQLRGQGKPSRGRKRCLPPRIPTCCFKCHRRP